MKPVKVKPRYARLAVLAVLIYACTGRVSEAAQCALRAVSDTLEVAFGSTYTATVRLSSTERGLEAWSYGLCISPSLQRVVEAAPGRDLAYVRFGGMPEYSVINVTEGGVIQAVVLDLRGGVALDAIPEANAIAVLRITLEPTEASVGTTVTVPFCDTVGMPPVATLCVFGNEGVVPAIQQEARTAVVRDPPFLLAYTRESYNLATSTGHPVVTTVRARSTSPLYAFSFGVMHDPAVLQIHSVTPAQDLIDALGGVAPDFWAVNTQPAGGSGYTVGVVFDVPQEPPDVDLRFIVSDPTSPSTEVVVAQYLAANGVENGASTPLAFTDALGAPPVDVLFDIGREMRPSTRGAEIIVTTDPIAVPFIRGEINGDGQVNISDAVLLLRYLFAGYQLPYNCDAALDVNGDDRVDISDPTRLLAYLFAGGPPPVAPFPECGVVSVEDSLLECITYPGCN